MLCSNKIKEVNAAETTDTVGVATVTATVVLEDGSVGKAVLTAEKGAPTNGRTVPCRVDGARSQILSAEGVSPSIKRSLTGMVCNQGMVDLRLGKGSDIRETHPADGGVALAVSLAAARAGAAHTSLPLYRYIGGASATRLPVPMMNMINGGEGADNGLDARKFMIVPIGFSRFSDALEAGYEIYRRLGELLESSGKGTSVGDDGGYTPSLGSTDEALSVICKAVISAGYDIDDVNVAVDCSASDWFSDGCYRLPKLGKCLTSDDMIGRLYTLSRKYPLFSVEDGLGEDDRDGWAKMTKRLGGRLMLVGDDLFGSKRCRLDKGAALGCGNAILITPSKAGTLSDITELSRTASSLGYGTVISYGYGGCLDASVSDIAVGIGSDYIKTGAPKKDGKNRILGRLSHIESELGTSAVFRQ